MNKKQKREALKAAKAAAQPTTTPVAAKAEAKPKSASKYRGVKSGMRVQEFQNWQIAKQPERKLTDTQLLDEMAAEFPGATGKIFSADLPTRLSILGAVRRLALAGKHGPCPIPMPAVGVQTKFVPKDEAAPVAAPAKPKKEKVAKAN